MSSEQPETAEQDGADRHASWAELFFDLIAVAGVAALAHVLVGDLTPKAIGLYAVLFLAFWLTWTTYTLYGNVAGGETRVVRLLLGMFGLGVMAASAPGIADTFAARARPSHGRTTRNGYGRSGLPGVASATGRQRRPLSLLLRSPNECIRADDGDKHLAH